MAFPTSWTLLQKLTTDNTKVSGSGDHTNIPLVIDENDIIAAAFAGTQSQEINTNYLLNDANLQGYWRFEADGSDSSGNGYTLTGTNPDFVAGKFGNGGDFESGSSEYLSIANASCPNLEISGSQTWSCWVKAESLTGNSRVMSKHSGVSGDVLIYINNDYKLGMYIAGLSTNTVVTDPTPITTGVWYHVCCVYDSSATKLKIFVNGVKTEVTASGSVTDTNGDFAIGRNGGTDERYWDGLIDDAAIWDRALSDAEVMAMYLGGADVRFSSDQAGTTQLAHEIVKWDTENEEVEVWVKMPTLQYDADDTIYLWGDNATATPQARDLADYGSEAVWSNGYQGVWHFQGNGIDATSNENHLTIYNSPSFVDGKFGGGGGVDFENSGGEDQYAAIAEGSHTGLYQSGAQTWTCWYKPESLVNWQHPMAFYEAATGINNRMYTGSVGNHSINLQGITDTGEGVNSALSTGTWTRLVLQYDGSYLSAWADSTESSDASTGTVTDPSSDFAVGRQGEDDGNYVDGVMDEVRISSIARTDGWIVTEYNNENSPSTFWTGSSHTSIKEVIGVVQASIKKVAGITNANIKELAGVANS